MQLKESETKLEEILTERNPDNIEVPADENDESVTAVESAIEITEVSPEPQDKTCNVKNNNDSTIMNNNLKKVTNIENEQLNKSMHSLKADEEGQEQVNISNEAAVENVSLVPTEHLINEAQTPECPIKDVTVRKDDEELNAVLRKNILSCVDKVTRIEDMKKSKESILSDDDDKVSFSVVCRVVCSSMD